MPRKCTICNDERVKAVDSAIRSGKTLRYIALHVLGDARRFMSVNRHTTECLKVDISTLQQQIKSECAIDHHDELNAQMNSARKLREAAERWLSDPNNKDQFTLAPRGEEIDVVYYDNSVEGSPLLKTESLQVILDRLNGVKIKPIKIVVKTVDMREFALKTIDSCDKVLDKFAKTQGLYQQDATNEADRPTAVAKLIGEFLTDHPDIASDPALREEFVNTFLTNANLKIEDVSDLIN